MEALFNRLYQNLMMQILKTVNRNLSKYVDVPFFLKFILLVVGLYYFNALYIVLTTPEERIYSPFLTHNLNYIAWIKLSILKTSNLMVHLFGLPSYLADHSTLRINRVSAVIMGWPCLGLGVMSFWIAFITAQATDWKKKLYWALAGVAAIWFMNCCRIALLLIAIYHKWDANNYNQHKMFDLTCYFLIFIMMYWYHKKSKKTVTESEGNENISAKASLC